MAELRIGESGRLPAPYLQPGTSSFVEFMSQVAPGQLAGIVTAASAAAGGSVPDVPHGTTIVAMATREGVVMAGDRRATAGSVIANRDIVKVFPADEFSCVAFAGAAGIGLELVKVFQVELEHFEKLEGTALSLEGKANRLAAMVRGNLGMAMQGLAAVPLFAGYDPVRGEGRIFSFDPTGGRYAESDHHAIGSGGWFARGSLKKRWRPQMEADAAVAIAVEALYDAADDDSATSGPDGVRRIYPIVAIVDAEGYREVEEERLAALTEDLFQRRAGDPGGALGGPGGPATEGEDTGEATS